MQNRCQCLTRETESVFYSFRRDYVLFYYKELTYTIVETDKASPKSKEFSEKITFRIQFHKHKPEIIHPKGI